jgi:hypothetical protein
MNVVVWYVIVYDRLDESVVQWCVWFHVPCCCQSYFVLQLVILQKKAEKGVRNLHQSLI